ncbi:hypothetical protein FE68_15470, partial [Staphylococcus aureus]
NLASNSSQLYAREIKNTSSPASAPKLIESVNVYAKNVSSIARIVSIKIYGFNSVTLSLSEILRVSYSRGLRYTYNPISKPTIYP